MSAGALRHWLVRLAPYIGLLAACGNFDPVPVCNIQEDGCPASSPQYSQYFEHAVACECRQGVNLENVTIASGSFAASAAARSCLDTIPDGEQVPAAEAFDAQRGVHGTYASASPPKTADSDPFTDHLVLTCTYDIETALPVDAPATCTGTTTWTLAAALRPGGGAIVPGPLQLAAQRIAIGSEPETSFGATVTFSCGEWSEPPDQTIAVPVDRGFRRVGSLTGQSVDCAIAVTLDSSARAAGRTVHQLLVTARSARRAACVSDADCGGGDRCSSSSLQCTSGLNGASCLSPYDADTGLGDCSEEAPFCSPLGCSNGQTGRPCGYVGESGSDLFCAEGFACTGVGSFPSCQPL